MTVATRTRMLVRQRVHIQTMSQAVATLHIDNCDAITASPDPGARQPRTPTWHSVRYITKFIRAAACMSASVQVVICALAYATNETRTSSYEEEGRTGISHRNSNLEFVVMSWVVCEYACAFATARSVDRRRDSRKFPRTIATVARANTILTVTGVILDLMSAAVLPMGTTGFFNASVYILRLDAQAMTCILLYATARTDTRNDTRTIPTVYILTYSTTVLCAAAQLSVHEWIRTTAAVVSWVPICAMSIYVTKETASHRGTQRMCDVLIASSISVATVGYLTASVSCSVHAGSDQDPMACASTMSPTTAVSAVTVLNTICTLVLIHVGAADKSAALQKVEQFTSDQVMSERKFMRYVFHEVRVPLNVMSLAVETAKQSEGAHEFTLCKESFEALTISMEQMSTVLNDVLMLEKVESGMVELECTEFDVSQPMREVARLYSAQCDAKGINMSTDNACDSAVIVMGDVTRINQILSNFVTNSIKFTPAGGAIMLRIRILHTSSSIHNAMVEFSVTDTGIGFNEQEYEQLFRPFSQVRASMAQGGKGTGLGLSICKALAKAHDGEVDAHSSGRGKGATFWLRIPAVKSPTTSPHAKVQTRESPRFGASRIKSLEKSEPIDTPPPLTGKTAVVVEDSALTMRVLMRMIHGLGIHTIYTAANGKEGLDIVREKGDAIDFVLTDVDMPVMNGVDMAAAMRKEGYTGVIIGMSGHALEEDYQNMLGSGMDTALSKPVRKADLVQSLLKGRLRVKGPPTAVQPTTRYTSEQSRDERACRTSHATGTPRVVALTPPIKSTTR